MSTGEELWYAGYDPLGFEIIPRPVVDYGMVYTPLVVRRREAVVRALKVGGDAGEADVI